MSRKINVAGCVDRSARAYLFAFGACGPTYVLAYAYSLEDALEEAASWLADNAPGHIIKAWDEEHTALVREACEDAGLAYPPPEGADLEADGYFAAQEDAEADLTYTEAGYLTSYEWFIVGEDMTPAEIKAFAKDAR